MTTTRRSDPPLDDLIDCLETLAEQCGDVSGRPEAAYGDLYYHARELAEAVDDQLPDEALGMGLEFFVESCSFEFALNKARTLADESDRFDTDAFRVDDDLD